MTQEANPPGAARLAAIDVGSNSIRLVVAQIHPSGEYRVLDDERETTRLAKSLNTTAQLDRQAMDDSIAALRRFRKIAEGFNAARIRTIATCAVREAENGVEFLHRARQEAGLEVEVVSSREEAHLAFRSVERAFELGDKSILLADLGGGSTELVLASNGHIEEIYNTRLGALRLSEVYGPGRQLFGDDYQRLVYEIDQELRERVRRPPFYPHLLIGSGGTFTSLAAMMAAAKGQGQPSLWGYRATRAEVRHLLDRLQKMSLKQRRSVPGLNADRAEIIVAGLAIIDRIMKRFRVNVLQVHTGGVRDGLLLEMIHELQEGKSPPHDRRQAAEMFAASCGVDMAHSRHVAALAGSIYQQLCAPFGMEPKDQALLETAALLQDVGYLINYESHHKHSYQLILNSQLPGFSRHDLELIANVARYHRGARPKRKHATFRELSEQDQIRVRRLAAILRIAGGLDRSHSQAIDSVRVQFSDGKTRLHVASRSDPEVDLWAARRRARLFERVFQTEMLILPV